MSLQGELMERGLKTLVKKKKKKKERKNWWVYEEIVDNTEEKYSLILPQKKNFLTW